MTVVGLSRAIGAGVAGSTAMALLLSIIIELIGIDSVGSVRVGSGRLLVGACGIVIGCVWLRWCGVRDKIKDRGILWNGWRTGSVGWLGGWSSRSWCSALCVWWLCGVGIIVVCCGGGWGEVRVGVGEWWKAELPAEEYTMYVSITK